jgi:hypothetical protein
MWKNILMPQQEFQIGCLYLVKVIEADGVRLSEKK